MGERRQDSPQEERLADAAVDVRQGQPEVLDVLGESEPDRDHRAVDDAVDGAIEVPQEDPEEKQDAETLRHLFDDRSLNNAGREVDGGRWPNTDERARELNAERGEECDGDGCGRPP